MLGRDASSVFPTESKGEVMKSDAAKELLGSTNRFITQSEVWLRLFLLVDAACFVTHAPPKLHHGHDAVLHCAA